MSFLQNYAIVNLDNYYSIETLTGSGVITPDFSSSSNFKIPLTASGFLANPTGATIGQSGLFMFIQNDLGDVELSFDTYYNWPGGVDPVMTSSSGSVDIIPYFVASATSIICQIISDVR